MEEPVVNVMRFDAGVGDFTLGVQEESVHDTPLHCLRRWREAVVLHDLAHSITLMDEQNSSGDGRNRGTAGRVVLAVICALLVMGLLWGIGWKLGWWNPGFGMLSAKLAAVVSVGIVSLVAWAAKRR
ncbi:hypothetical protein ADL22_26715 [Streptomyces sp. NRRL F-4489]|nr:hypothetical protein ADL22_26715 [Streptomyces sp. NRRL F-4489]